MIKVLPTPKICQDIDGGVLEIPFSICAIDNKFKAEIEVFLDYFKRVFKKDITQKCGGITLKYDISIAADAYIIDSKDDKLYLMASDKEGLLYGFSTLLQIISVNGNSISVPRLHMEDFPDKEYRSVMIDLGRKWHTMDQILKFVDLCFIYKINYLHLHFVDTERYSLPSKAFPKLAIEGESYTFDEIKYLNDYAFARGINLVPETECPGHASSITRQYPEVFANVFDGESGNFYTELGAVIDESSLLCAGSKKAFDATLTLIDEMIALFPNSKYIHIGGDEAPIKLWNQCPHCREYMKNNNLKDVYDLYSEYIGRVVDHVLSLGKTPIVWEGFPKLGSDRISKEAIVMAWESHYHLVTDLLDEGFTVINVSWQPLYIVPSLVRRWSPEDILNWNVYNWQHWWQHSEATLNPITVPATDKVLGATLCSWELTFEQEISRVMENLIAMNERVWNTRRRLPYSDYCGTFKHIFNIAALII